MNRFPLIHKKGFTLIEILVGVAVFCLLLLMLFEVLTQVNRIGQSVRADTDRVDKVGVAFDMMRRDLAGALMPYNPDDTNNLQFLLNPASQQTGLENIHNQSAAFWQAPVAANLTRGDVAVVGYFIRLNKSANPPHANLCRLQVDPNDANYLVGIESEWLTPAVLDNKAPATSNEYQGLLVDNAIGLWMRAIDENGDYYNTWDSRARGGKFPVALEIALLVVDQGTSVHLSSLPDLPAQNFETMPQNADAMENEIKMYIESLPDALKRGARVFRTKLPIATQYPR